MVAPGTVDEEVLAGQAFFLETQARQQHGAALVLWPHVGLDAVEVDRWREGVTDGGLQGLAHEAPSLECAVDRVAEHAVLECAAGDLGQPDAADQQAGVVPKLQPPAKCRASRRICRRLAQSSGLEGLGGEAVWRGRVPGCQVRRVALVEGRRAARQVFIGGPKHQACRVQREVRRGEGQALTSYAKGDADSSVHSDRSRWSTS